MTSPRRFIDRFPGAKRRLKHARGWMRDPLGQGRLENVAGLDIRVPSYFATGAWSRGEAAPLGMFRKWLAANPDCAFLDVGCSVGIYSLTALAVNPRARVFAFDPDQVGLRATARLCRHVGPERLGLVFGFVTRRHESGSFTEVLAESKRRLAENDHWEPEFTTYYALSTPPERTPSHSLDGLSATWPMKPGTPLCVKIDVEGAELEVLHGAQAVLRAYRPSLLLSVHPDKLPTYRASVADVRQFLETQGYAFEVLSVDHEEHWWCTPKTA